MVKCFRLLFYKKISTHLLFSKRGIRQESSRRVSAHFMGSARLFIMRLGLCGFVKKQKSGVKIGVRISARNSVEKKS